MLFARFDTKLRFSAELDRGMLVTASRRDLVVRRLPFIGQKS
jgi:hypothetical protein